MLLLWSISNTWKTSSVCLPSKTCYGTFATNPHGRPTLPTPVGAWWMSSTPVQRTSFACRALETPCPSHTLTSTYTRSLMPYLALTNNLALDSSGKTETWKEGWRSERENIKKEVKREHTNGGIKCSYAYCLHGIYFSIFLHFNRSVFLWVKFVSFSKHWV